jgi:3-oxoacyl-[acyl-carrier-protein] synthase III
MLRAIRSPPEKPLAGSRHDRPALFSASSILSRAGSRPVGVIGLGAHVPAGVLSNADLERMVQTSDEWIRTRTGIAERHVVGAGEATSDLAVEAGRCALASAGMDPGELELIVLATATPDSPVPATVCHVQRKLGAERATGFDLAAGCTGFVVSLMTAHGLVASGRFRNALVLGAEVMSSMTDYTARETCVLLGDGAGAMLIAAGGDGPTLIDHQTGMDGRGAELIQVIAGGSRRPACRETVERREHYLAMRGREVFRFAVTKVPTLVREILARNGLTPKDVDLVVPHQANLRILESVAADLGIALERFAINIDRFGNTSSASIPIALEEAHRQGRLARGDRVLLVAFGAGLTWGASLLSW